MRHSIETGFSFGLTSAVITTLGLMVGLSSGTHSELAVIGGVLTIAVADSLSDAMGIHISEETEGKHTNKQIWLSTASTFITKFAVASTFIVPVLLLPLNTAILASVVWGMSLIAVFSHYVGSKGDTENWKVVLEHLIITLVVVIVTHYLGILISTTLG